MTLPNDKSSIWRVQNVKLKKSRTFQAKYFHNTEESIMAAMINKSVVKTISRACATHETGPLSLCFKPASRYFLFSKMNSRQENRSKLSFTARIISKCSLERFLSICGEKMSKGFLKLCKLISNLILSQIKLSQILQTCINYIAE